MEAEFSAPSFTNPTGFWDINYGILLKDFWEYNPATDTWIQKANCGGLTRYYATGFSNGNKGYIGIGSEGYPYNELNDFWEYDPATDGWLQKASFANGTSTRSHSFGFSLG